MKSIVRFAGKPLLQTLKIKDIALNVPSFKSVKKQPSVNGKSERLRHAFKVWYTACYKAFQKLNTARAYLNTLALNFKVNKRDKSKGGCRLSKYFTISKSEQFVFYKVPKVLFTDEKYKTVSTDAKMLYGLLLDRMYLSVKNGWVDKQGRVYQFFTVKQAQELLHFGHEKICKLFSELEKADLISRKRQGQGKANIIYLKKFN